MHSYQHPSATQSFAGIHQQPPANQLLVAITTWSLHLVSTVAPCANPSDVLCECTVIQLLCLCMLIHTTPSSIDTVLPCTAAPADAERIIDKITSCRACVLCAHLQAASLLLCAQRARHRSSCSSGGPYPWAPAALSPSRALQPLQKQQQQQNRQQLRSAVRCAEQSGWQCKKGTRLWCMHSRVCTLSTSCCVT
jgi:hypothetical protein